MPKNVVCAQIVGDGTFKTRARPYHLLISAQVYTLNTFYGTAADGTNTRLLMRVLA